MTEPDRALDFIAIGLGPFNLSLACLMEPLTEHQGLFLEKSSEFNWHPGMLMPDATLQNPFLADLVTLADPTSRFSYLNYCKQHGKIFSYFIREKFYLTRREYNDYCRWAATQLKSVRFGSEVTDITYDAPSTLYCVRGVVGEARRPFAYWARRLVLGIGSKPYVPPCCAQVEGLVHTAHYLAHKQRLQGLRSITVLGSGQSAAEVYHDLLKEREQYGYALHWITRSPRIFAMDTTKFVLELLCPDYIEHFCALADAKKEPIAREHRSVYAGINVQLINAIYELLHEQRASSGAVGHILSNAELRACKKHRAGYALEFFHREQELPFEHHCEGLVLGTGYVQQPPSFIDSIGQRIRWDTQGRYEQSRNYSVDVDGEAIFVQNAGMHSHGFTGPDLSLACHRNAQLIHALTGIEYYALDYGTAMQDFGPPAAWLASVNATAIPL